MRVFSWLVGTVIVLALATGGIATVARHNSHPAHPVAAVKSLAAADGDFGLPEPRVRRPRPEPSPTPPPEPVAAAVAPAPAPGPAPRPAPAIVVGSTQQALINQDRAANGLGPLTWNGCLYNVAIANAQRIAAQHYLSHTSGPQVDLGCGLGRQAGENVGYWSAGINDGQINTLFMNSPEHRANILGPYHYVATAWVVGSDGRGYVAVEFS